MVSFWTTEEVWTTQYRSWPWFLLRNLTLWVVGGQTGHHCGLYELGECSAEVWRLHIHNAQPVNNSRGTWDGGWTFTWGTGAHHPYAVLPFPGRCGAAPVGDTLDYYISRTQNGAWDVDAFLGLVGGQLSYTDPTCTAPPRTVNDVCLHRYRTDAPAVWNCSDDAPFSPRRDMLREDVFMFASINSIKLSGLAGGLRYTALTTHPGTSQAAVQSLELYSDVWACEPRRVTPSYLDCVWGWRGNATDPSPSFGRLPTATLPLPTAGLAPAYLPLVDRHHSYFIPRIGGFTSREAERRWTQLLPSLEDGEGEAGVTASEVDWSLLAVNTSVLVLRLRTVLTINDSRVAQDPSSDDLLRAARGLPHSTTMEYQELYAPDSPYQYGMDWLFSYAPQQDLCPGLVAVHPQRFAFADEPHQSTPFLYQAASSANTTRPQLNFELRRLGSGRGGQYEIAADGDNLWIAGSGSPNWIYISGGRSGQVFSNDYITLEEGYCVEPMDPSMQQLMGAVEYSADSDPDYLYYAYVVTDPIRLRCASHHHWEPPSTEEVFTFFCAPNLLWVDADIGGIRRCVPDTLDCAEPFEDRGTGQCEPPHPVISRLSQYSSDNADALTLTSYPVSGDDTDGTYWPLEVYGSYFRLPIEMQVGGYSCSYMALLGEDAEATCINGTDRCYRFGSHIQCRLPTVFGLNLPVQLEVGEERSREDQALATISSSIPIMMAMIAIPCVNDTDSLTELHWHSCPNDAPTQVIVYMLDTSVVVSPESQPSIWLDFTRERSCNWSIAFRPFQYNSTTLVRQGNCWVNPRPVARVAVTVQVRYHGRATMVSERSATLAFAPCRPGTYTDYSANFTRGDPICIRCPPGTSTNGANGTESVCEPCAPGSYARDPGMPNCLPCPANQYVDISEATACQLCPANSWATFEGRTRCDVCDLDSYITAPGNPTANGTRGPNEVPVSNDSPCVSCPQGALCLPADGNISATVGVYLVAEPITGRVTSIPCSYQACVSDTTTAIPSAALPQMITVTGLRINNHCGGGRYPAYSSQGLLDLPGSDGLNLLCAACLPGYSEVNGRCIECDEVRWLPLTGLLLLSMVLVYLIHRLPHDWTGSASLSVMSYFVQQSCLFLASESMPQILSLLNVNLLGDSSNQQKGSSSDSFTTGAVYVGVCIAPLTDVGRIIMRLVSPIIALAMLAFIAALQLACRRQLQTRAVEQPLVQEEAGRPLQPTESPAHRWYRWVFGVHVQEVGAEQSSATPEESLRSVHYSYLRSCIRVVQLSYTALALLALSFFRTVAVGDYGTRLADYPTIDVQSKAFRTLFPVMIALLAVFVVGLPVLLAAVLYRALRQGKIAEVKSRQGELEQAPVQRVSSLLLLQWTAPVKAVYWWMAPFSLLRRLCVVLVLLLVTEDSVWVWVTLVNYLLLTLHVVTQPYERRSDNQLETVTLLSLAMQSTLLSAYPPPQMTALLFTALLLLVLAPMLLFLTSTCRMRWRRGVGEGRGGLLKLWSDGALVEGLLMRHDGAQQRSLFTHHPAL